MNTDSGYRLRTPETTPEGCSVPDSLRAWLEQSTIESPIDPENGGGQGEVLPIEFNQLKQQVQNNSDDITGLNDRVTALEGHSYPRSGSVSIPAAATTVTFQVATGLTGMSVVPVGGPLTGLWLSSISGSVTAHFDATAGPVTLHWTQS